MADNLREVPKLITSSIRNYDRVTYAAIADNIVSIPKGTPIGARTASGITIGQIIEDLENCSPLTKNEHAKMYLANFVKWDCKIMNLSRMGGQIEVSLFVERLRDLKEDNLMKLINLNNTLISVSLSESENPHLKLLKKHDSVTVDGRISQICVFPMISVTLDNTILVVKDTK